MVKIAHFYTYDPKNDMTSTGRTMRTLAWIEACGMTPVPNTVIEVDESNIDEDGRYVPQAKLGAAPIDKIVEPANFENVPMLRVGPTGKVMHLIKSWDEVDALVDRINTLALKAFGHHPSKPFDLRKGGSQF